MHKTLANQDIMNVLSDEAAELDVSSFTELSISNSELFTARSGMSHGSIVVRACTSRGRIKTTSEPVSMIRLDPSSLISIASLHVQVDAASA